MFNVRVVMMYFSMQDKYQRVLADRENVRIRLRKEVEDTKIFGIQKFSKELLEVSNKFFFFFFCFKN